MKSIMKNILLIVLVVVLVAIPLFMVKGEFTGADSQATDAIMSIEPNYKPWFNSIYTPSSGEVESFLFALQAAMGSGIVCFYLGYKKGQHKKSHEEAYHD
ncbi:energy-coupling factor ABC transporter substrate-binding protein [Desulfitobacterium metallireducens]|uniref:Cobalt transport protein CbiN n=1 Tax=Desulfitobacterium metallireducens DSM 15288 TaxID=871968 RepID=W0E6T0_9FIRM|nr:energy-coupling factor ABC transporter substrate-binding protein [Desulfitobacterium metallireducens]AHF06600.1 cobalt transporter CbiN [Desulfitobacterium metallireducens DSM 15288]